jgi:hypothetical protein
VATTRIVWNWGTNSNIDFHPDSDILDFGWFQADQFTVSEVNGTVVIAIPSNHQTYTLQHTTLHDLHLSNIVANDASTIGEWTSVLGGAPVTPRRRRHRPRRRLRSSPRARIGRPAPSTPPA